MKPRRFILVSFIPRLSSWEHYGGFSFIWCNLRLQCELLYSFESQASFFLCNICNPWLSQGKCVPQRLLTRVIDLKLVFNLIALSVTGNTGNIDLILSCGAWENKYIEVNDLHSLWLPIRSILWTCWPHVLQDLGAVSTWLLYKPSSHLSSLSGSNAWQPKLPTDIQSSAHSKHHVVVLYISNPLNNCQLPLVTSLHPFQAFLM